MLSTIFKIKFQSKDDASLCITCEEVRIQFVNFIQSFLQVAFEEMYIVNCFLAGYHFDHFIGYDTSEFRTSKCRCVAAADLLDPFSCLLCHDRRCDRINTTAQAFSTDDDIRIYALVHNSPHFSGSHKAGLHFIGDVERSVFFTKRFYRFQVARLRNRESIGCRDGLNNNACDIFFFQYGFHCIHIVHRHLLIVLVGTIAQKCILEKWIAGRECQSGMTVVTFLQRYDLTAFCRITHTLDRHIDSLAATTGKDGVLHTRSRRSDKAFCQFTAGHRTKVMVSDIKLFDSFFEGCDHFRITVSEVKCSAVQMKVHVFFSIHVPEIITFAFADDDIDSHIKPGLRTVWVPVSKTIINRFLFCNASI